MVAARQVLGINRSDRSLYLDIMAARQAPPLVVTLRTGSVSEQTAACKQPASMHLGDFRAFGR